MMIRWVFDLATFAACSAIALMALYTYRIGVGDSALMFPRLWKLAIALDLMIALSALTAFLESAGFLYSGFVAINTTVKVLRGVVSVALAVSLWASMKDLVMLVSALFALNERQTNASIGHTEPDTRTSADRS